MSDYLRPGERRHVTVLFADMEQSTEISEHLDPEELDRFMGRVFGGFERIVDRYEGVVEKYIGDAIVAVFGARVVHDDDPVRAVQCALDFLESLRRLAAEEDDDRGVVPRFRIGINTGLIATGRRGGHEVVTGLPMNIAARLQSAAEPGWILVSASTRAHCIGTFEFGAPQEVLGKGLSETIVAYPVIGEGNQVAAGSNRDDPFVGRDDVLQMIHTRYLRSAGADGYGIILTGPPGIGKTRTIAAFLDEVRQLPRFEAPILTARPHSYRSLPFACVVDLIETHAGIRSSDGAEATRRVLANRLGVEEDTAEAFARLRDREDEPPDVGEAQAGRNNQSFVVLYVILKVILSAGADGPYAPIIVIDNVPMLDRQSRDFFRFFMRNSGARPFFLLSGRSVDEKVCDVFAGLPVHPLPPLSADAGQSLIDGLWPEARTGARRSAEAILSNADGNPLFIREYVAYAKRRDDVGDLPSTIQNILLSSLEALPERRQDLVKKLSVFVHSFSVDDVRYLEQHTDGDPSDVDRELEDLREAGIIVCDGESYMFRHDLLKQAVYESLLNFNKRVLHRLVADRMSGSANPHTIRLLHHLVRAGEYERAKGVLRTAPGRSINMDLISYIDTILGQAEASDGGSRMRLLFAKAAILVNNGHSAESEHLLTELITTAVRDRDAQYSAGAYHLLTGVHAKDYSVEKTIVAGRKALHYYRRISGGGPQIVNVLRIMSVAEALNTNDDGAWELYRQMEGFVSDDPSERSDCDETLVSARAELLLIMDRPGEAYKSLARTISSCPYLDEEQLASLHSLAVVAALHRCDFESVLAHVPRLVELGFGLATTLSRSFAAQAIALFHQGSHDRVEDSLRQSEFYLSQVRNELDAIDAYRSLSVAYHLVGEQDAAVERAQKGVVLGLQNSAFYPTFTMLILLVELALNRNDAESARYFLEDAGFYVDRPVALARTDRILYHRFRERLGLGGGEDTSRRSADALLDEHREAVGSDDLFNRMLLLRPYGAPPTFEVE